ncbi:5'/3'-nucleotidase SurE [Planomonospora sp. ID67723]|uniref:5'/3'-nucleotidase SurE n=1 Tax=Planomonospora sp. ID67723 TaxID=2738134 RepID=UPI0018C3FCED|nr:5'/3'-nucleotidase SurE [Planomonospora sp. ID67723]MBG0829390.1 5'/3'-nucleotidase SurE [Planomonospora sp. ID67723]
MKLTRRLAAVLAASSLLVPALPPAATGAAVTAGTPAAGTGARQPLTILLSNDDGYSAPGIKAVFDKLTAAGHDVTIVAPATNQSGASVKRTVEEGHQVTARKVSEKVWAVTGTPGDSVLFGLGHVFAGRKVDLVVSGTNFGQNIGVIVNNSGTVGAAVTAIDLGVPAVAVSTEFDFTNTQNTIANMPATADFTVRLVERLQDRARGGRLLPEHTGLNVNYPTRPGLAPPAGVALTRQTRKELFAHGYRQTAPDAFTMKVSYRADTAGEPGSDLAALAVGKISVTPVDADWSAGPVAYARTAALLTGLR